MDDGARRERDLDRYLTFTDAVVAIAITLLVLPLVELTSEVGDYASVADLLRDHQGQIWAFLLSFAVIARLWFAQHRILSPLLVQDPWVARILLLWTLTIVVLPFPTALVAESADSALTKALYVGVMAVSSALLAVVAWVMRARPAIREAGPGPDPAPVTGTVVAFVVALVIMLAVPAASYFPLLLLLLSDPLVNRWQHRRRGRR